MRIIGHLDMDAFFAAVEEREKPRLRGKPIAVGADPIAGRGRGVISTANYKAREYGIHSAMSVSEAWRLSEKAKCAGKPEVIFIACDFSRYREVSGSIMQIVRGFVPVVEEASIDEIYTDLSFIGSFQKAKLLCEKIKKEILEKEKLTCSIGVGPSKLIAKIASDLKKPDGLTVIEEAEAEKFLEPLSIRKIPGIGPKTESFFEAKGIKIVRDLKQFSKEEMKQMLGKWGSDLYEKIRGGDNSPVTEECEIKSIGGQETFPKDTRDPNYISERLAVLCTDVIMRFKASGFKSFRSIVVTVRFTDFETKTRSQIFSGTAFDLKALTFAAMQTLLLFLDQRENPKKKLLRLIGVRLEKLS